MWVHACECGCSQRLQASDLPGSEVTGGSEPPGMGAGNRTWVLWKGRKHSLIAELSL